MTVPTTVASPLSEVASVESPPTRTEPVSSPLYEWGIRPFNARMRVDLPHPEGPATRSTSPGWISSAMSRRAGSIPRRYRKERPSTTTTGSVVGFVMRR
jgi:hypothetical protein